MVASKFGVQRHTVHGTNPANHLGCKKNLVKNGKLLATSTGDRRISEPSTVAGGKFSWHFLVTVKVGDPLKIQKSVIIPGDEARLHPWCASQMMENALENEIAKTSAFSGHEPIYLKQKILTGICDKVILKGQRY